MTTVNAVVPLKPSLVLPDRFVPARPKHFRIHYLALLALICLLIDAVLSPIAAAQSSEPQPHYQINGGYSWLSNSFNGVPGSKKGLNGWSAGIAFQPWHHLRFKLDYSMYRGTNLGNPQHAFFLMGGGQYEKTFHRERFFAEALVGEGGLNGSWYDSNTAAYKYGNSGMIASLTEFLGGGADTPIGSHFAFRVEGGVQHSNFDPIEPNSERSIGYHLAGIPNYFGRFSGGIVWMPSSESSAPGPHTPVESEVVFESLNSFGHIHIFANSWWSELNTGGIEYDRHSWGRAIGARVDYSAEIMPVMILRMPAETDTWGNRIGLGRTEQKKVPGLAVLPIGVRLMWNDSDRVKPFYSVKGGMTAYTQKAFSQYASYENFVLDQTIGVQFRVSARTDFRVGVGVFHESNGFVVPSNPGLDALNWSSGIIYHLGGSPRLQ
jgi:hypothetical protein